MKKIIISSLVALVTIALLTGCNIELGTGSTTKMYPATVGAQLVDLKKAKDDGAITQAEYDSEKAKFLNARQ
jgi:hypothetical protein